MPFSPFFYFVIYVCIKYCVCYSGQAERKDLAAEFGDRIISDRPRGRLHSADEEDQRASTKVMRTLKNADGKKGQMLRTAKENTTTAFSIPSYQRHVDEIEAAAIRKKSKVVLKIRDFCPRLNISYPHLKRSIYVVITFVPVIVVAVSIGGQHLIFGVLNKNLYLSRAWQRLGVPARAWQHPGSSKESVYKPALKAHKQLRSNSYQAE